MKNKHSIASPIVQLAIDLPTVAEALALAAVGVRAGVDLLEAGTPLIVAEGASSIGAIARAFPDYPVLADYKTMDSGFKNVLITQAQGGHYMTVCANAPDETVQSAIAEGRRTGVVVVADTIGVKDQVARARQCEEWGIDMIYLHYGADQRRADASRDTLQWLPDVLAAVDLPVGVATFGVEDAVQAVSLGASLVAIGHPLITGPDAEANLAEYVRRVKEAYRPYAK